MELEKRRIATQSTLDAWRGRVFDWNSATCVHLAREHLVNMGHDLPEIPEMTGPQDAVRALQDRGWSSVEAMLDDLLEPITPARMMLGDIATAPGQDDMATILISAGPFKLMGWHPDGRFVLWDGGVGSVKGAWRG